uniref:Protein kinase domain-containing protein n=1 Tax=Macrostomum lignano TaxID=282301 RepID=A0A1I8HJF1_9PLAT
KKNYLDQPTAMEPELRAALEAKDDEKLQQLCPLIDSNMELTVGGYKYFFNEERTQPVTHHVVCKTRSSQCLKLLIDKFGPEFVTCRNDRDETVVHLIAQHQDDSWMELIPEPIVQQSLKVTAWKGRTVTHYAAMNDVSDSVLKLLVDKCGVDCLKSLDNDGNTALHLAAQYQGSDSMKLAKTVLGTDCFQSRGFSNRTVIHYAASNTSSHTSLKWLVVLCGTDCLKASDKDGYTAVHLAAQYQGIKSMELMKDALGTACFYPSKSSQEKTGADSMELMKKELGSSCFQLQGKSHKTSIHYAAANRESNESLKWLLNEYGPESLKVPDKDGNTAVHLAAQNQGVDSMELMKTKLGDACFEIKGKLRWTPVHFAATNLSSNASLKWLVKELGSDCLELPDKDGNTAIHLAARYQGIDSMKLMKEALGKDCFLLKGCLNRTAIHCAATNESSNQSLKWLLKGYSNRMPIHIAASSSEKLALFNWLIKECGPDCLKVPEKNGNTAVHLAAQYQGIESMKLIKKELGTGCFHLKGRLMRTPVHCAACNKFGYSVLKWLVLKCGPDCVAAVDKDGNTIVHLAAEHQSADLLQFLIDQIGPQVLSLKNNKGETLVECVEKDSDNDRKARKRNWIELTKDFESFYLEEGAVSVNAEATDDLLNQLRTALEARDDALLRRLCLLLNSNVELTVNDCLNKDRTQSVTHHVVCKSRSLQCLKLLISKFGPDCLLNRNNRGETAVHLTAMHQENLWMKLILEALGRDCFKDTASNGRMVTHYAATNETSNSSLKWLVAEFGRDCLLVPDKEGSTVVHLAAEYQGVDSMELMNRELETDCFKELKGSQNRTVVHYAAGNNISDAPLRWLVKKFGPSCIKFPDKHGVTPIHLVTLNSRSTSSMTLNWLVSVGGPDCLTIPDNEGNTPVHLAAEFHNIESMKFIKKILGPECFRRIGFWQRTPIHCAAANSNCSALLGWLIKECGHDCLMCQDKDGNTPVHRAACFQPVKSLKLLADQIGPEIFSLKNASGKTIADFVNQDLDEDRKLQKQSWISSQLTPERQLNLRHPEVRMTASVESLGGSSGRAGGKPFREKWENKQLLGRGGFGDVHKVLTDTGVTCAAKTLRLPLQLGDQLDSKARKVDSVVESEKNLCQLQHPNIVRFLYITQPEPATVVVFMELLDGHTLENFIDEKPIDEEKIRHFSKQICSALLYLHSQQPPVIHRDINCTNIIVLADGTDRLKLIDFGLSIKLEQSVSHISASTSPKGTLNFMAPELLGDGESESVQYSRESDIWAFGCSVYQMAIGARPFATAKNLLQLVRLLDQNGAPLLQTGQQSCSQELLDFYSLCTAKDRKARISAEALMKHKFFDSFL